MKTCKIDTHNKQKGKLTNIHMEQMHKCTEPKYLEFRNEGASILKHERKEKYMTSPKK